MSEDGKTLEIFKVETKASSFKTGHLSKLVEKLNNDPIKSSKVSDTMSLAIMVDNTNYTVQYKQGQQRVNTVAQEILHPLSAYASKPVPKPPIAKTQATWEANDTQSFMKMYEIKDKTTGKIAAREAEVTRITKNRFESSVKEIREEIRSALDEAKKTGRAEFVGYTISRKSQEAQLSTQGRPQQAPPIPSRKNVASPPPIPQRPHRNNE